MPIMISTKPHTYAMKVWNAGDEFEARREDVVVLSKLGRATLKRLAAPPEQVGPMTTRSTQPAPEVQPPTPPEEPPTIPVEPAVAKTESGAAPPQRYRTRRLRAGGE